MRIAPTLRATALAAALLAVSACGGDAGDGAAVGDEAAGQTNVYGAEFEARHTLTTAA